MLEAVNLGCVRGERRLFRDLAFSVKPGEIIEIQVKDEGDIPRAGNYLDEKLLRPIRYAPRVAELDHVLPQRLNCGTQ